MIRLYKLKIIPELEDQIRERTERYLDLVARREPIPDSLESAYKHPEVKQLLRRETSDKCAYCESKVPHVDYGDVEHIVPKSLRPALRFAYENLTYTCSVCNTKKGNYFDEGMLLLNPYEDNPANHLIAEGPMVLRLPNSNRGLVTQKKLDLNRINLIERRAERLEAIATLVDQIARTQSASIREVLENQVREECMDDKEYSFVVRAFVSKALLRCN